MGEPQSHAATEGFLYSFRALRIRDYRNYWIASLGMTGTQVVTQFGLAWLVLDLSGSLAQLGVVLSIQGLAWTLVALAGGVLADRYSRRNLIVISQLFGIASLATLATLTFANVVEVWHVYLAALILGTNQAVTMPARTAIIRSLVTDDYMLNAVALNAMQQQASRIVWPMMTGVIIALLGVGAALVAAVISSAIGVILLVGLRGLQEAPRPQGSTSALHEIGQGVSYSFAKAPIRLLMVINFGIAFLGLVYLNLAPGFARQELGFDAATTGLFMTAAGIGAICGSVMLVIREVQDRSTYAVLATAGFGLAVLALSLNFWTPTAFALMVFFGFSNSSLAVSAHTVLQTASDPRYLGRVMSLWSLGGGMGALAALPVGLAGDEFGLRWALGLVGAIMVLLTGYVAVAFLPAAKRALLDRPLTAATVAS